MRAIRLSHYVLDALTPVHLLTTSSGIHDDFESALDQVAASVLVEAPPPLLTAAGLAGLRHCRNRKIVSGYDIADEFARHEGELSRGATVAEFATVQREGDREVTRDVEYFNRKVLRCHQRDIARFIHVHVQEHYREEAAGYDVAGVHAQARRPPPYTRIASE